MNKLKFRKTFCFDSILHLLILVKIMTEMQTSFHGEMEYNDERIKIILFINRILACGENTKKIILFINRTLACGKNTKTRKYEKKFS